VVLRKENFGTEIRQLKELNMGNSAEALAVLPILL